MSSWVRDINVKQSTELGTGNFRKPRRSSVMPPELMIQKYKEIIKTKEDLERKSLVSEDALLKGLKTSSVEDDNFDFSPSIPKKTKHYSLMKNTLKKNKHNPDNLLEVSNENPFLQYNNAMTQSENPHSIMVQSENFSVDSSGSLTNDNVLIESIKIPAASRFKHLDDSTGNMVMSVSLDMEEEKNPSKTKEEGSKEDNSIINGRSSVKKTYSHFRKVEENTNKESKSEEKNEKKIEISGF